MILRPHSPHLTKYICLDFADTPLALITYSSTSLHTAETPDS